MTESQGTITRQPALTGSFSVERSLAASPDQVFAAYAEPRLRARWLRVPGDPARSEYELDFRPGGHELRRGRFAPSGVAGTEELIEYRAVFWDIQPGARLVFGYELVLDGIRRWVSQVAIELAQLAAPAPGGQPGTRLLHREQYVLLAYAGDGAQEIAHLKGSTGLQLNGLAAALSAAS
jgi:uncharacterized protein YndB with AHSA1/START domain